MDGKDKNLVLLVIAIETFVLCAGVLYLVNLDGSTAARLVGILMCATHMLVMLTCRRIMLGYWVEP